MTRVRIRSKDVCFGAGHVMPSGVITLLYWGHCHRYPIHVWLPDENLALCCMLDNDALHRYPVEGVVGELWCNMLGVSLLA
jgi:hypothetical protein